MSAAAKFWAAGGAAPLGTAPYPERSEWRANWLDRRLSGLSGSIAAALRRRRLSEEGFIDLVIRRCDSLDSVDETELLSLTDTVRARLLREGFEAHLIAEAFALVRQRTRRALGVAHRPVQIHGARLLLSGSMLEMATGEGKTMTAMLAASTAALAGLPVHVVTVNGYLAERDAGKNKPVYDALGLSSAFVVNGQETGERIAAYAADIVHCDNKELTFDYLKDRLAVGHRRGAARARLHRFLAVSNGAAAPLLLRGLHFCIIDEADSVLIDEAKTPLIISAERATPPEEIRRLTAALELARQLRRGVDFTIREDQRDLQLTTVGRRHARELAAPLGGLWRVPRAREETIRQALTALHMFSRDQHYIIVEDAVHIVDEFTGRPMPDRSWEAGLHQLIEIKEGVATTPRKTPIAQITFQRFFRRYRRLSGMTGTGMEIAGEVWAEFDLRTVPVPTHRPLQRRNLGVSIFKSSPDRWRATAERVRLLALEQDRAVLIGTRSVEASELLAAELAALNVPHVVLNARHHAQEAEIITRAGNVGTVTVATNMAGRGTDIELTEDARARGGLHVILTEYHESSRIDRQLIGRAGRQGDPGSFEAIVSYEDELFQRYTPHLARLFRFWPGARGPGWSAAMLRQKAQSKAERAGRSLRLMHSKADHDQERRMAFAGQAE